MQPRAESKYSVAEQKFTSQTLAEVEVSERSEMSRVQPIDRSDDCLRGLEQGDRKGGGPAGRSAITSRHIWEMSPGIEGPIGRWRTREQSSLGGGITGQSNRSIELIDKSPLDIGIEYLGGQLAERSTVRV